MRVQNNIMFLELIVLPEARTTLFYAILIMIILAVQCSGESCYQYRSKANVTIDTDQCLRQNYTEPKTKRSCVQSCINKATVRTVRFISAKREKSFLFNTFTVKRENNYTVRRKYDVVNFNIILM